MSDDFKKPWIVSEYLDDDRWGIVDQDNRIIVGILEEGEK